MARLIDDSIDYRAFLAKQQAQNIRPASDFIDSTVKLLVLGDEQYGDPLPWRKTHKDIRLRPKEVSIWAGINNHGKSNVCGQTILWQLRERRALIASMEMPPERTLLRMLRQAAGAKDPAMKFVKEWGAWTDDRLWIYDQQGSVDIESIVGMCWYACEELGCDHIVIDSLLKCGIAPDDYGGQKEFVDQLCQAAKHGDSHIHLVHHMRKGRREADKPDKFDVRGASEITDLVDNVFIVHRNLDKEANVAQGKEVHVAVPDTRFICAKQRHGTSWIGEVPLYFEPASGQLIQAPGKGPMQWRY